MGAGRKFGFAGAAVLVLAAAAYSAWWWIAARAAENGITGWIAAQRAQGAEVSYTSLQVGGWPFSLTAVVKDPAIRRPGAAWSGERVEAAATPWDVSTIALTLPGPQRVVFGDRDTAGSALTAAGGGRGVVTVAGTGVPVTLALAFTDLTLAPAKGDPIPISRLEVAARQPQVPPTDHRETGLAATVTAHEIRLPGPGVEGIEGTVRQIAASVRVQGRPPALHRAAVEVWMRNGGVVEVDSLGIDWGSLEVRGNGTLSLDSEMQPLGSVRADIRGADETLSKVERRLPPAHVATARTILAMLSRPAEGGGAPVVRATGTIHNGGLYVGPFKVARIPPIPW